MTSVYVYAALLLHKAGRPINRENVIAVLYAANGFEVNEVMVQSAVDFDRVDQLVAALKDVDITEVLRNVQTATVFRHGEQQGQKIEVLHVQADLTKEKKDDNATGLGQLFGDS